MVEYLRKDKKDYRQAYKSTGLFNCHTEADGVEYDFLTTTSENRSTSDNNYHRHTFYSLDNETKFQIMII